MDEDTTVITERVYGTPVPADAAHRDHPGRTTIADEVIERVIERVVELAVAEIPGLHDLRPEVDRYFGDHGGAAGRAVAVRQEGEAVEINIAVAVEFGHPVHEAISQLRARVTSSAERLLGLAVTRVNVAVTDVAFPDADADADADAAGPGPAAT